MAINYGNLLEQYGGIGLEKQYTLADIIGENDWNIDTDKGIIVFGEELEFPMQILGTYSHSSETWLWAWANEASNIPANLLKDALKLKTFGEENNFSFFTDSTLSTEVKDVHCFGIIASAILGSSAYYCGNFGDGIVLITIKSDMIDSYEYNEQIRLLSVYPNLIATFIVNHKNALSYYTKAKGYTVNEDDDKLLAKKNENMIEASFDEIGRLIKINGEVK